MLIVTAHNVTSPEKGVLAREDGTADYDVWVGINQHCIWKGSVTHRRELGAAELLRMIALGMDESKLEEEKS